MKELDLTIYRGDNALFVFKAKKKCKPIDVSDATFDMHIKREHSREEPLKLSSGNGISVFDKYNVRVELTHQQTAAMAPGTYEYDLQMTYQKYVRTLVRGYITVTKDVTND